MVGGAGPGRPATARDGARAVARSAVRRPVTSGPVAVGWRRLVHVTGRQRPIALTVGHQRTHGERTPEPVHRVVELPRSEPEFFLDFRSVHPFPGTLGQV